MTLAQMQGPFEGLLEGGVGLATAPLLIVGVGALLLLLADIVDGLRPARPLVFAGTLVAALVAELRVLFAEVFPGAVLHGTFEADGTTALWGLVCLFATGLAWAFGRGYYRGENRPYQGEHDVLFLAALAGMLLMIGSLDLLVFFVGLELLSLPLYALAAFRRSRSTSVEAGIKYFLLGSFAAGFFLYGASLVYAATGSFSLLELRETGVDGRLATTGVALITASLFFKVSVFPFHLWVPDVYQGSPTPVTALMATGTKAAAFAFLIKVTFLLPVEAAGIIAVVALVTMAAGNLGALVQDDLKRLLAYSGVAHAGTVLLVVAGSLAGDTDPEGALHAALFYLGAYAFTATGAFGLLALLEADGEHFTRLENLRGLARSRPGVAAALALFMLSLGGIPATGGFLGKWMVFAVLVRADMLAVAVLGVLLSVVALGYYLRVIVVMYMQPAPAELEPPQVSRPWSAGLAAAVCALFVLAMGCLPGLFFDRM